MGPVTVKVKALEHYDPGMSLPSYATAGAAGADIRAALAHLGGQLIIHPGTRLAVPTGLVFEIPPGYEIQVRPRSGLSLKTGLLVVNAPGTIDCDYRGELMVLLGNLGSKEEIICHGDRIAQLVISPLLQAQFAFAETLGQTQRGEGGFGSTGIK